MCARASLRLAALITMLVSVPVLASHLSGYAAPTGLDAAVAADDVTLTWNMYAGFPAGCTQAREIRIQRSDNGGDFNQITSVGVGATSYLDEDLAAGTYQYRIQARCNVPAVPGVSPADPNNLSLYSSVVTAEVILAPPCVGAPLVEAAASPVVIWPPNGKQVAVTITGTVSPAPNCAVPASILYSIVDEYGEMSSPNPVSTAIESAAFNFQVSLEASRRGDDLDGRLYTILLNTTDGGEAVIEVRVPHDQRKK